MKARPLQPNGQVKYQVHLNIGDQDYYLPEITEKKADYESYIEIDRKFLYLSLA